MIAFVGGKERTAAEFRQLLAKVGFGVAESGADPIPAFAVGSGALLIHRLRQTELHAT